VILYAVCDNATGRIVKSGGCSSAEAVAAQAEAGQTAVDVSAVTDWSFNERHYRFDAASGQVVACEAMPASVPATAAIGAAVSLTLPSGAAVSVDGAAVGTVDGSGSMTIAFSDAGTYELGAALWPYLDFSATVAVS